MARSRAENVASVDEALSIIVRQAGSVRLQQRVLADAGVDLDRSGHPILRRVEDAGRLRVTELADLLGLDVSTVSRQVRVLEERGMLRRATDEPDRRASVLEITDGGVLALKRLREARFRLVADMLADWDTADIRALEPLLHRFASSLQAQGERS